MTNDSIKQLTADYEESLDNLRNAIASFQAITDAGEFDRIAGITQRIFTYSSRVQHHANKMAQVQEKGLFQ